ncbi:FAD-dependent 5-carboxymethylaminomethyl-2-thiouridine(34) oxidoreductase MnmC [Henriciella algicola]|uniref:FAD-dependent 5-carboxymethylaminomethyl-2-thiouridine(34) oxidoreductase MnmC n=1 Tax=Henriciella algicola TaxID=1608422 RepID=UPI001F438DDC|nr:FAD-dependent 5-carboxymethylaminomethyl-2-thiouridine(34) oxidoreductase MnmC [Henriciella algicola]
MSRLPPRPELDWKDDGTPQDVRVDDIYFSRQSGLEETRLVFLKGCGLPERWKGRGSFTVGELGFGTGLNFLGTWQLWRGTRPTPKAWLHFISFEGFPLDREDAARALSAWPEISELSDKLIERWPERALGVQRIVWPEEGVTLTLHTGDISETLPASRFAADAWFLDGFSPAKNPQMWDKSLWPMVQQRCTDGVSLSTFTVAGFVRRGLADAGFDVAKVEGFGRKRERLEVRLNEAPQPAPDVYGLRSPDDRPNRVRIIGAGIAGACLARTFLDRGLEVEMIDAASGPAKHASGNPLALVMPRLDAGDTVQARLLIDAYLRARQFYAGRPGVTETNVLQRPKDEREAARIAKVLADPPLGLENLEAAVSGQLHKQALILEPEKLIAHLLEGAETRFGEKLHLSDLNPEVPTIIAAGQGAQDLLPWLGLTGRLGQVEFADVAVDAPPSAIASGHYALALGQTRLWGATFEAWDGTGPDLSEAARATNMAALEELDPYWRQAAKAAELQSRAGVRATTPDRLPLIGAVPDEAAAREIFDGVKHGQAIEADAPLVGGLFMAGGFGSRGFTWGPWAGEILAGQILEEPAPATEPALEAVSPMRLILRALKRGG